MTELVIYQDWETTGPKGRGAWSRLLHRLHALRRLSRLRRRAALLAATVADNSEFAGARPGHLQRWLDLYLRTRF
jgi:hypothetical protein